MESRQLNAAIPLLMCLLVLDLGMCAVNNDRLKCKHIFFEIASCFCILLMFLFIFYAHSQYMYMIAIKYFNTASMYDNYFLYHHPFFISYSGSGGDYTRYRLRT